MSDQAPIDLIRSTSEMVDYFWARKEELQLSDAFIEEICDLAAGHVNKVLGPAREKRLSAFTLDLFLEVLCCSFIPVADPDKLKRMEARWERRDTKRVHFPDSRVSKRAVERAKPLVLKENAAKGGVARNAMLASKHKIKIAKKGARARWAKARAAQRLAAALAVSASPR